MFHGVVLCLLGLVATGSAVAQPLEIERGGNEQAYFTYDGEPLLSFGGLSDFLFWFADDAHDYRQWADWARDHGINHIRAYPPLSWKHSVLMSEANGGKATNVQFPYRLVDGSVARSNARFDLLQFDQSYWQSFRKRMEYLQSRGIIVHLLMWNNWQLRDSDTGGKQRNNDYDWAGHFFNPANNVNSFTDHLKPTNRTDLFHSVSDRRDELAEAQQAFFLKLIDETYDLDNVYYDLVHELAEHQGNWNRTRAWIDSMAGAIEKRWKQLGNGRPLIIGMDTGGLSSAQRNWIFSRPYFDVLIYGKQHTVKNATAWRKQYDKPYIGQEAWDDNGKKYSYGIKGDRVKLRKYFWKFMMAKCQQMDVYTWLRNQDPREFDYNPRGHNGFEKDALVLQAFWARLGDYPNLWFEGQISPSLGTNHRYVLSSNREAVAYISSNTGQQNKSFKAASVKITKSALQNGKYTVDIIKPDKPSNDGLLQRITNVAVSNGTLTVKLPAFKDDIVVHVR
jgi:hypothetical protein